MISSIIIIVLGFIWLGYESDWMRVRLPMGKTNNLITLADWIAVFNSTVPYCLRETSFTASPDYSQVSRPKEGYIIQQTFIKHNQYWLDFNNNYAIYLSPSVDTLCGKAWLDKHWDDLADYVPEVELYFGNGYRQRFTLKKPELIGKIVKINCGKKYFRELATQQ